MNRFVNSRLKLNAWLYAVAGLVLANLVLFTQAESGSAGSHRGALTSEETEALRSAQARVGAMLTFSHTDLETDLSVASSNAARSFRDEYRDLLRARVAGPASARKVTSRSRVISAGVQSHDRTTVTVLALVRSNTAVGSNRATTQSTAFLVTMRHEDGQWLVAGLSPE